MDDIDIKILSLLGKHGRMTWAELAGQLSLSPPSAAERVRRLEDRGVIKGYHASIDFRSLGYTILSFISICLLNPTYRQDFINTVAIYAEVEECHHIAGEEDFLLKVRCFDTEHLDDFLNNRLKQIPGISRTRLTISLSTVK